MNTRLPRLLPLLLCLLLVCCACQYLRPEPTQTAMPSATPAAERTPDAVKTQAPAPSPSAEATDAPTETLLPDVEDSDMPNVLDYLPATQQKIIMKEYVDSSSPRTVSYLYAAFPDEADPSYVVSGFYEDQPMYYTNYYADDEGIWALFSDEEDAEKYLLLPADLTVGKTFVSRGENCTVTALDASLEMGGYMAEGCIVIRVESTTYSTDVFYVYEKGLGKICEFFIVDENVTTLLSVCSSCEDITSDQAAQIIADSRF